MNERANQRPASAASAELNPDTRGLAKAPICGACRSSVDRNIGGVSEYLEVKHAAETVLRGALPPGSIVHINALDDTGAHDLAHGLIDVYGGFKIGP